VFKETISSYTLISDLNACTKVIYEGCDDRYNISKSIDWKQNIPTSLWIFPKGINRNGEIGENSVTWKSIYGSIITSSSNKSTEDGINEKGLVANLLYLVESDFEKSKNPILSISAITQYVLDNYSTVEEAIDDLEKKDFQIIASNLTTKEKYGLHLAISDVKGDLAIIEFLKGKMTIHHSKKFKTITNSSSVDINCESTKDEKLEQSLEKRALATAFGIIRNTSVPIDTADSNKTNATSTLWQTVSDQKALRYYFDSTTSPFVIWVDINKVNLNEGASSKKLDLKNYPMEYHGDVSDKFEDAKPFQWLNNK
jgi:choloylglycine hydrolase